MNNRNAIITVTDEINCFISAIDPVNAKILAKKYSPFAKNYFFNTKFKRKQWDGKIPFYTESGKTYVNLLPEIIDYLESVGYDFIIKDHRKNWNIDIPMIDETFLNNYPSPLDPDKPLILGEHQVRAINAGLSNNTGIILASTGSGKSVMISVLTQLYYEYANMRSIIIVPSTDLLIQTKETIERYGNDIGVYCGDYKDLNHTHCIATWQALKNNADIISNYQCVFVDETHIAKSTDNTMTVLNKILTGPAAKCPIKIGLTGTLPKHEVDLLSLKVSLGDVICTVPAYELINKGWSAKLQIKILKLVENFYTEWEAFKEAYPEKAESLKYKKFKKEYFPEYIHEMEYLKKKSTRNKFIAQYIDTVRSTGNCFVLCNGVEYGKRLASMIPGAYFIYGKDSNEARKEIYKLFENNDNLVVVSSFQLASTGLDIRRIYNLFGIDGGKGFERIIQTIGRGLRIAKDKTEITYYDISTDLNFGDSHLKKRKGYYNEEKYPFIESEINYEELLNSE